MTAMVAAAADVRISADAPRLWPRRIWGIPTFRSAVGVVALFALSPLLASGSVGRTALLSMLPFAALITVAAVGQTLVIQQRGLDLSVPGAISLSALLTSKYGAASSLGLWGGIALAVAVPAVVGLCAGAIIASLRLPPLVVTIASNAVMVGLVNQISGGFGSQSPPALSSFALDRWFGIPVPAVLAVGFVLLAQAALKWTVAGRRFELVGENPRAANFVGIPARSHEAAAYLLCGACSGMAGVLLTGVLRTPTLTAGDSYLLPSIAAVVLGGTSLAGGRGSLTGSALGALLLAQLNQLVQTFTQNPAAQNLTQALIIGIGIIAQLRLSGAVAWVTRRLSTPGQEAPRAASTTTTNSSMGDS